MSRLSVKTPLGYDETDGPYTACHNMKEVAYQNLKSLALTNPGERIFEPNFGIGLRRRLFEHDTTTLRTELRSRINQQIAAYIPYVQVLGIEFTPQSDASSTLGIRLTYAIVAGASKSNKQEIVFGVPGEESSSTDAYAAFEIGQSITQIDPSSRQGTIVQAIWDEMHEVTYKEGFGLIKPM